MGGSCFLLGPDVLVAEGAPSPVEEVEEPGIADMAGVTPAAELEPCRSGHWMGRSLETERRGH